MIKEKDLGSESKEKKHPAKWGAIVGIIVVVFGFFYLVSLCTYDASDLKTNLWTPAEREINNVGGRVGAYLANYSFLYFGGVSYVIFLIITVFGVLLFLEKKIRAWTIKLTAGLIFLTALATILSMITPQRYNYNVNTSMIDLGGAYGMYFHSYLSYYLGGLGTFMFAMITAFIALIFLTEWYAYYAMGYVIIQGWRKTPFIREKISNICSYVASAFKSATTKLSKRFKSGQTKEDFSDYIRMREQETKKAEEDEMKVIEEKIEKVVVEGEERNKFDFEKEEPAQHILEDPGIKTEDEEVVAEELKKEHSEECDGETLPPTELLESVEKEVPLRSEQDTKEKIQIIENTLRHFEIPARVVQVVKGPVVTNYEIELAPGVRVHKVLALDDDLALALKAPSVRIVAPIPGKGTIGIEVPNPVKEIVRLKSLLENLEQNLRKLKLPLALGKDAGGTVIYRDLEEMPHLLVAGTTGSGKSVCLNSIILSLIMQKTPHSLKMILIDPKMVELSMFHKLSHLICPVVVDMKNAAVILDWLAEEMDKRYVYFSKAGARKVETYNNVIAKRIKEGKFNSKEGLPKHLPYLVVVIDELADLMMVAPKEVESTVTRLAQKSRATGIHMVLATQRPSVDVITGLIKANMPARIAFKVASKVDSRTILDRNGAERLLGKGDMLLQLPGNTDMIRAQCTFVSDVEMKNVVKFYKENFSTEYDSDLMKKIGITKDDEKDELFDRAVELILEANRVSVTFLQRKLEIGYARAARLVDMMESKGIVSEPKEGQVREVLITKEQWLKGK